MIFVALTLVRAAFHHGSGARRARLLLDGGRWSNSGTGQFWRDQLCEDAALAPPVARTVGDGCAG